MTYIELKNKKEQKLLAEDIKIGKSGRKPKNRKKEHASFYNNLYWNRVNYRHKHIAYCEFFNNTPYEMIERPSVHNKPNRSKIDSYKTEWMGLLDEAIRDCA